MNKRLGFIAVFTIFSAIISNDYIPIHNTPQENPIFKTEQTQSISEPAPSSSDFLTVDLVLTKPDTDELHISNQLPDGRTLLTKFKKTPWGTWNIANWFSSDSYLAGDSDWEYVFRVSESPDSGYYFSGGAHGRERLNNLKIFDGINNTPSNVEVGSHSIHKLIKIIEETSLTFDAEMTKEYARVQRIYLISPSKITLNTTITFTNKVFMGTSYVCMFPVSKEYGRYIKFNDTGTVIATPPTGKTLTNGGFENFLGREKTLSVNLWGDANPNYQFKIWIDNENMVDGFNNSLKTFYWDCNIFGNKLYFSKYDNDKPNVIEPGTVWYHVQGWELHVTS